jgi:Kelch motif/Galactose oxidase, central domain
MLRRAGMILAIPCIFLIAANSWNRKIVAADTAAPRAGSLHATSPMLEPRSGHTATLLPNGKVLITGGMRRNQDFYRSAELYDPVTGKFRATGSMFHARVGQAAALLASGKVLIVGGWVGHECTDTAELYDPGKGTFTEIAHMTAKRGDPGATALANGDVLITGGAENDSPSGVATAEIYHGASGTFEAITPMHAGRIAHTTTVLSDGRVLITGGRGNSVTASAEIFDPATKTFTSTGNMITARYKHSAGRLPDGCVLIAGGSDARDWSGALASAEIYDPRTGKFTETSSLSDARFKLPRGGSALSGGKLVVAGGSKTVDVFDPATGKFLTVAQQMPDARHFMTETALADGSVLLTGGYPNNDLATAAAWIYRP